MQLYPFSERIVHILHTNIFWAKIPEKINLIFWMLAINAVTVNFDVTTHYYAFHVDIGWQNGVKFCFEMFSFITGYTNHVDFRFRNAIYG